MSMSTPFIFRPTSFPMGRSHKTFHMAAKQNTSSTNNGKSPYQVKTQKEPNLTGIQEFGAAAYVKDLKAGKLDTRVKKG